MAKTLIVISRVKDLAMYEGKEMNVAKGIVACLTKKVEKIIARACARAQENGRSTIMLRDL